MMYLALSYDHRLIDGKEAVSFLVAIKNLLEDPDLIREKLDKQVDLIIDGGFGGHKASTVINLVDADDPYVVRVGCGDPAPFMVEA